jgi:hypothetical protein
MQFPRYFWSIVVLQKSNFYLTTWPYCWLILSHCWLEISLLTLTLRLSLLTYKSHFWVTTLTFDLQLSQTYNSHFWLITDLIELSLLTYNSHFWLQASGTFDLLLSHFSLWLTSLTLSLLAYKSHILTFDVRLLTSNVHDSIWLLKCSVLQSKAK